MKKDVSRREFASNLAKVLIFGGLSHFGLSAYPMAGEHTGRDCPGGQAEYDKCELVYNHGFVESDFCPGGGPDVDICNLAERLTDYCPGERVPQDECSPSGAREAGNGLKDDECDTGVREADVCSEAPVNSDQCQGQKHDDDECLPTQSSEYDKCWSGLSADDSCAPNGDARTDECPGGGWERDNCVITGQIVVGGAITNLSEGDVCSPEGGNPVHSDSCGTRGVDGVIWPEDQCGMMWAADVCYEGTNVTEYSLGSWANGGKDICGTTIAGIGAGADTCLDGAEDQDLCGGENKDYSSGDKLPKEVDICLAAQPVERGDLCMVKFDAGGNDIGDPDSCLGGLPTWDMCRVDRGDEDECPGGVAAADRCDPGSIDKDECPGGGPTVDECNSGTHEEDECPGFGDEVDVCLPNVAESDECWSGVFGQDNCPQNDNPDGCKNGNPDYAE